MAPPRPVGARSANDDQYSSVCLAVSPGGLSYAWWLILDSLRPRRSRTEPNSSWYTECFSRSQPHDLHVFLQACGMKPGHNSGQLSQGLPSETSFIRTPISEKALLGLLAGVPFILLPDTTQQNKTNRPIGSHTTFSRTLVEFTTVKL